MLEAPDSRRVRFGPFELDPRSGELSNSGHRQTLPEQPLALLRALLARPGELVTRDELRQQLWPADTFVDFEHGLNAAVKRVRDALGDSADAPRFIETLPRRGYRFITSVSRDDGRPPSHQQQTASALLPPAEPSDEPAGQTVTRSESLPRLRLRWWDAVFSGGRGSRIAPVVAAVLVIAAAGTCVLRSRSVGGPPQRVVPLTTLPGWEASAGFSPDGQQVAFGWNPGLAGSGVVNNWDVYVKIVGSPDVRRLTTDSAQDYSPSWSPDGLRIAFLRSRDTWSEGRIYLMSALGGSDRKLSDFLAVTYQVAWSPDGRFIAAGRSVHGTRESGGIYLIPVDGGEPRPFTQASGPATHRTPAFSPDGRHLAYASCSATCDIYVLGVSPSLTPAGPPRRLTSVYGLSHLAWTRDGSSIVYDDMTAFPVVSYLWRVRVEGTQPPERIELAGLGSTAPVTAPSKDRLVFTRFRYDVDIYRAGREDDPRPVAVSSFADLQPAFSPDGGRIAFCSSRAGEAVEIWIAAADGSGTHQLTNGPGRWQCSPHWSPDGLQIAFESQAADGHWHIWIIEAEGGTPRQATRDAGDQNAPTWSLDGKWIYFSWSQGGGRDMWRTPVAGGQHLRVTTGGSGVFGAESSDGQNLLYQATESDSPLLTTPIGGGSARELVKCVRETAFSAGLQGIYYVACDPGFDPPVHLLNPATGESRLVGRLKGIEQLVPVMGLSVSPDGRAILYSRHVSDAADLMLIENFK
jgi:Tol biopolymer transport system component/DNA-binding winged helix-turn-helix (wHTH) protein